MISVDDYLKDKEDGLTQISKTDDGVFIITTQPEAATPPKVEVTVKIEEIDKEIARLQTEIDNYNLLKKDLEEVK